MNTNDDRTQTIASPICSGKREDHTDKLKVLVRALARQEALDYVREHGTLNAGGR
jgi:hypothetical protein